MGGRSRELPYGAVASRWDIGTRDEKYCPGEIYFLPQPNHLFVSPFSYGFAVWNATTGGLVREIKNDRRLAWYSGIAVSPSRPWIAASLRDDPQDTPEGQQDFKIWDVTTGETVYETPLQPWRWPYWTLKQNSPLYLRFSPDGRYLLVLKYKELKIYEILPRPDSY